MYLVGWKEMAAHLKICKRHLERAHFEIMRIPFIKDGPTQSYRVRISIAALEMWYLKVIETRKKLKALEKQERAMEGQL